MSEGHTIHRYARLHRAPLGDRRVAAWSPQGRFAAGAAVLDDATVTDVEAHGKHLSHRFVDGDRASHDGSLDVHLGLFGRFRQYGAEPVAPTGGTRLVLATLDAQLHLAGFTACELIDPPTESALRARPGPRVHRRAGLPSRRCGMPIRAWGARWP